MRSFVGSEGGVELVQIPPDTCPMNRKNLCWHPALVKQTPEGGVYTEDAVVCRPGSPGCPLMQRGPLIVALAEQVEG